MLRMSRSSSRGRSSITCAAHPSTTTRTNVLSRCTSERGWPRRALRGGARVQAGERSGHDSIHISPPTNIGPRSGTSSATLPKDVVQGASSALPGSHRKRVGRHASPVRAKRNGGHIPHGAGWR